MSEFTYIVSVFFMLLGPAKLIPVFGGVMRGADLAFKRDVAIKAAITASALCAMVVLAGGQILSKYFISFDNLRISGGLVLLVAALNSLFQKPQLPEAADSKTSAMKLAVSPVAVPGIVPPTGIVAILFFLMLAPEYPGMKLAVVFSLVIVMVLNFVVMYFIDRVMKPELMLVLTVLGSVFGLVQLCLGVKLILAALTNLGLFKV